MLLKQLTVKQSLNKAYRLIKPERADIEKFKGSFKTLLGHINPQESEENMKGHVMDFLKTTWYSPVYHVATKGRTDFVIHTGKEATLPAGVLFETKKPSNPEMVTLTDLNRKAMHEIILYYLRERIEHKNDDIKYLVITSIYDWFVFDAQIFEKLFFKNTKLVKDYKSWRDGQKVSSNNDHFYNSIAKPILAEIPDEIEFTYFNIKEYEKPLTDENKNNDNKLIPLFKILSPIHLLKLPFANDSNTLDKSFYNELLYIIGLEEVKDGGKKIIRRRQEGKRLDGSLLENTIVQLETENCLYKVANRQSNGATEDEQLFSLALELCITWINRVLFLKLLEAQLLKYHKGNENYRFLNYKTIPQFDELYKLYFQVLAVKQDKRIERVKAKYRHIPYLNSSLFEKTALEEETTMRINMLDDDVEMPLLSSTILKEGKKPIAPKLNTLQYLFDFLNAYDFASEGSEEIQEERKTLINASVLGLIFEKINGYKDGSIYTPGFITMYMCRQSIRQSVVDKFKEKYKWQAENFEDLHNYVTDNRSATAILEYNALINSLTICDPAVGSGHFLVSALNELIAIKSELGILADRKGKRLTDHIATVENDELLVTDKERNFFTYWVNDTNEKITIPNTEVQRVQETLFHEKQSLIENSLFGVDINPKSVQICRLRLWIELLKNAYYIADGSTSTGELQTLPNIDINIKTGNSLISRFGLDEDLKAATPYFEKRILEYKQWVADYKQEEDKNKKRNVQQLIIDLKKAFLSKITDRNPVKKKLDKLTGELLNKYVNEKLFEQNLTAEQMQDKQRLENEIKNLSKELETYVKSPAYSSAFEWRFEFPEVLTVDGTFTGFDILIGNPPYFSLSDVSSLKSVYEKDFRVFTAGGDIYSLFYELAIKLLKKDGRIAFITSNKFERAKYGKLLRLMLVEQLSFENYIDFAEVLVFDEATVFSSILTAKKGDPSSNYFNYCKFLNDSKAFSFLSYLNSNNLRIPQSILNSDSFSFANHYESEIISKVKQIGIPLKDWDVQFFRGITTGYNAAFFINEEIKEELCALDNGSKDIIKPVLRGADIKKYNISFENSYMLFTRRGIDIENYPAIKNHLYKYFNNLKPKESKEEKSGRKPGSYQWFEIQDNTAYYSEFEKEKIVWMEISDKANYALDNQNLYLTNSAYFISGESLKYIISFLNSKVCDFFFNKTTVQIAGGRRRYTKQYVEQIPIPSIHNEEEFNKLVDEAIYFESVGNKVSLNQIEDKINSLVYEAYNLTPDEIAIVEQSTKKEAAV